MFPFTGHLQSTKWKMPLKPGLTLSPTVLRALHLKFKFRNIYYKKGKWFHFCKFLIFREIASFLFHFLSASISFSLEDTVFEVWIIVYVVLQQRGPFQQMHKWVKYLQIQWTYLQTSYRRSERAWSPGQTAPGESSGSSHCDRSAGGARFGRTAG